SFEYQVHPVGPLLTALALYPLEQTRAVLRFYEEFANSIPDEVNTAAALATLPDGPAVTAIAAAYTGDLAAGEKALERLRRFGKPIDLQVAPMSYVQLQHWLDPFFPDGYHYYAAGPMMRNIPDEAADLMLEHYRTASSAGNLFVFQQLGNAANRVPNDATAFSHRDAKWDYVIVARWSDPAESETHFAWTRGVREALAPYATGGVYVNAVGLETEDGADIVRSAYGANYPRLARIKKKYDPSNLFRHNQNILPAP